MEEIKMQRIKINRLYSMKYICIILFSFVFLCCDETSNKIIPGIRVGKYFFGKTTYEQIFRKQGDKDKLIAEGLMFTFENNKLNSIAVSNRVYRTKENIGVGSTREAVIKAFGQPNGMGSISQGEEVYTIDNSLAYDNIIFYCNDDDIVTYILIGVDTAK